MATDSNTESLAARVGTTLAGKYRLVRLLGAGGMGAVYEAENTWTQKHVAVKLMLPDIAAKSDLAARFLREARAASKIDHPNVVQVLDMGQDVDGSLYIVQEFLRGSDLRRLLDERRVLPAREAIELIVPVMSALVAVHRRGIIHRDIKPENVFLVKSGATLTPKLIDFGIAKVDDGPASGLTRSGAAIGTPWYFSPESARGEKTDVQSDVWAVGIMLYEMLAGRTPWTGESYNALVFEIATAPIERLDTVAPKVSKALADVVHHALERDKTARSRSMQHFLGELLDCPVEQEGWRNTLRSSHDVAMDKISDTDPEDAFSNDPTSVVLPSKQSKTTLGQTARELPTQPLGKRWRASAWAGVVAVVATVMAAVGKLASGGHQTVARPVVMAQPTTTMAPSSTPDTFIANVVVHPVSGTITIDDETTGANSIARQFRRDGTRHVLHVIAPGYQPFATEFVDVAPQPVIELAPLRQPAVRSGRRTRVAETTPAASAPTPRAVTSVAAPATLPAPAAEPRSVNGSPVLTE